MLKILIIVISLFALLFNYSKKQIISASSLWIICYLLIMVIYPLYVKDETFKNEGLIDILALLGIICFFIGLYWGNRYTIKVIKREQENKFNIIPDYKISAIIFVVLFVVSIIVLVYLLGIVGIRDIIRGATTSKQFTLNSDRSSSVYGYVIHLMIPCILAMWLTSNTKKKKAFSIISLLLYIIETILFGFTRIFLISIIAIILIYEIRKFPQNKQIRYTILGSVVLAAAMVSLNFIRSLGLGRIGDLASYINLDYIFESTDFGASYYWFDRLLERDSPFINPIVYLKPVFMLIPRELWMTKPEPLSLQVLKYLDPARAATGYTTAGNSVLGEGYAVLGYWGIILYPMIWGIVCGRLDRNYYRRINNGIDTCLSNIFYYVFAVFIVISGQRGDWCQYMGIVCWFYFLPLYVMSKVTFSRQNKI